MNEIYKFLKENQLTQLDEKAFLDKYSSAEKAAELHSFFQQNGLTKLDSNAFYDKYLKKKESTQGAGNLVASPSASASSGSLTERLSASPALPAGARVDVPAVTPKRGAQEIATAVKPTTTPLQVSPKAIAAKRAEVESSISSLNPEVSRLSESIRQKEQQLAQLEQKAKGGDPNAIREYNRLYAAYKREFDAAKPTFDKFNSFVGEYDGLEKKAKSGIVVGEEREEERMALYEPSAVSKRLSNLALELETVLPAIDAWQRGLADRLPMFGFEDPSNKAMRMGLEAKLMGIESRMAAGTEGEIIESIKKGNSAGAAYGVFDAALGMVRSIAVGSVTFGAGIVPDMMAQTTRSYNKSKAESLGISELQLIDEGKDDIAIPTTIGAIAGSLELVGLKGIAGAINKKISSSAGREAANIVMAILPETGTEWVQAGLDKAAEELGKGTSMSETSKIVADYMFSQEGAEAAIKGMAGAGTTVALGRGVKALVKAKEKIESGQSLSPQELQEIAKANLESNGGVAVALKNLVDLGTITQQESDLISAEMDAMNEAAGMVPAAFADKATQVAPLVMQKQKITNEIASLEMEKAAADESFHEPINQQIAQLQQQKQDLDAQIKSAITPQVEAATAQEAGTAEGTTGVADTASGEGVSGVGVQGFAQEFFGGRVSEITSDLDARMQQAEEIDVSEVDAVVEDLIGINDSISKNKSLNESQKKSLSEAIEGKIDQLLNYEFTTATETETVAERTATKSIITTPRKGVRQTVSKERFDGAEVMSKGSKGKIERKGNFFDLVFGNNRIPLDWNFVEFVSSRLDDNGDLAVTLVDSRSGTEFMIMDNELSLDVAISESQKQIGVVPDGEFDIVVQEVVTESKKETKRLVNPEKPKQNEKAKQQPKESVLAESRGDRPQGQERKEGSQLRSNKEEVTRPNLQRYYGLKSMSDFSDEQLASVIISADYADRIDENEMVRVSEAEAELRERGLDPRKARLIEEGNKESAKLDAEKAGGKDSAKKPSAEKVSVGEQPKVSEGVRGQDTKGKEASEKSEAKQRIEAAKEKRKAAVETLKKQWSDAKNSGISFDFEKRMKEDKEFFTALRDIVRTNLEIGVLSFAENVSDVASIIGQELDAKAKRALRKLYGQETIAELKRSKKAEFEMEDIRQAITDYIDDNKQVLDEVANAKVTRLVNEVKSEGGVNQLIKYVEKLVDSKDFRKKVKDAANGLESAAKKVKAMQGGTQLAEVISSIRVAGVTKEELLDRMAKLLDGNKSMDAVREEASALLRDVNNYLSEKKQEAMPKTFADMDNAIKNALTEKVMNEETGEYERVPRKLNTARKVRNFINKVADIKEQALLLEGLNAITKEEAALLFKRIEGMETQANDAVAELKENVKKETEEMTKAAKKMVNDFKDDGTAGYNTLIKPLKDAIGNISDLTYSQAVRLQRLLEDASNGFYALSGYRDVVAPIIDKKKTNAAKEIVAKVSRSINAARKGSISDILGNVPKELMTPVMTSKRVRREMETRMAAYVDDSVDNARQETWLSNMYGPFVRTGEVFQKAVASFNREFNKMTTGSHVGRLIGKDAMYKTTTEYRKAVSRLGYYMMARSEPSRNIIKEQYELVKSGAAGLSTTQKEILAELNERYPDGKVPLDFLNANEKKMLNALDTLYGKLSKLQEEANLIRGQEFRAIEHYYPFMALDFSTFMQGQKGLHDSEAEVYSDVNQLTATQASRNPKIRSDRGLQRNPDAAPFLVNPDAAAVFSMSSRQVLQDRILFPEVYASMKAFNESKKIDNGAAEIFINRYRDMVRAYVTTVSTPFLDTVLRSKQIEILTNINRYILEPAAGSAMYGSVPDLKFRNLKKDLAQAAVLSFKGDGYKNLLEMGATGRYKQIEMFEELGIDKLADSAKEFSAYITSPDAINDSTYRRAAFVGTMKDRFKKITGKPLNVSAAAYNKEYMAENKEALQQASEQAYNLIYAKHYPKDGRANMPAKVVRVRLWGLLGENGLVLDRTRSQWEAGLFKAMFIFGSFSYRAGQLFRLRMSDLRYGTNYGRAFAARSLGAILASTASYQYGKQVLLTIGSTAAIKALLDIGEDDEEMEAEIQRINAEFARIKSTQYGIGQVLSAFIMLLTSQSGSIGKTGVLLGGYVLNKMIEEQGSKYGMDVAEVKRAQGAVGNMVLDATFNRIPTTESKLNEALVMTSVGGGSLFLESIGSFYQSMTRIATDPTAESTAYALGTLYNAFLSQKTGIAIPFLGTIKNERIDEMATKDMSVEQIKKRIRKDKNYEKKVFEDLAYEAAWKAKESAIDKSFLMGGINRSETEDINPLVEAYEKALKIFPEKADEKGGKREIYKKLTERFESMLYPYYFNKIKNSNDGAAVKAASTADELKRVTKALEGDISEATRQRLLFEFELLDDYATRESRKSTEFRDAFDERTAIK